MKVKLEPNETNLIRDAMMGHWWSDHIPVETEIRMNVEDVIRLDGAALRWEVDPPTLFRKLDAFTDADWDELLALLKDRGREFE